MRARVHRLAAQKPTGQGKMRGDCSAAPPCNGCYRQVTPAPTWNTEKLASVTIRLPLVRLPLVDTSRFAYGEIRNRGLAWNS